MRRRLAPVLLAAVVAVALAAGCNRGQDPSVDTSGSDTTSSSAPADSASTSSGTGAGVPVSTPPVRERAYLTAVRVDTKPGGASRVVFEFDPAVPGHRVDFVNRPVTMDGSGDEVRVAGEGVLEVTMENAAMARFEGEKVIPTYTGPRRVRPTGSGEGVVVEVVEAGDFEGLVHWVIGLRQKDPKVSVSTLSGPSRIVLDFSGA